MCGVIVVDAGRSRFTCLGRDSYIHDHCLGYHHDYFLFYQLPNSNLFTHRMLFSWEKTLVKTMAPRVYLNHILKPKNTCCTFILFILFCIFVSIYLSITYNLILQLTAEVLTTPCLRWVQGFVVLCAGAANEVLHDSPTGLITLVS